MLSNFFVKVNFDNLFFNFNRLIIYIAINLFIFQQQCQCQSHENGDESTGIDSNVDEQVTSNDEDISNLDSSNENEFYVMPDSSIISSFENDFGNLNSSESGSDESISISSFPQFPKQFYENFIDIGNIMVGGTGSGELSWWQRIKNAFFSLAHFTKTKPECYNALPMNSTDISGVFIFFNIKLKL